MERKNIENTTVHVITSLSSYIMTIRDELSIPYDLSPIQSRIIFDLNAHPSSKITDVCKRLSKSTNSISPLIKRLENKGFIERKRSKNDARITYVSLTQKSLDFINDLDNDIRDYTEPMFKKLNDEELNKTLDCLIRLREVIKE